MFIPNQELNCPKSLSDRLPRLPAVWLFGYENAFKQISLNWLLPINIRRVYFMHPARPTLSLQFHKTGSSFSEFQPGHWEGGAGGGATTWAPPRGFRCMRTSSAAHLCSLPSVPVGDYFGDGLTTGARAGSCGSPCAVGRDSAAALCPCCRGPFPGSLREQESD